MAAAQHLQSFATMLKDLRVVIGAKNALSKGNSAHASLQTLIQQSAASLEQYYSCHMKDVKIPDTDRTCLKSLCESLHEEKAQKAIMTIVIGDVARELRLNPDGLREQQIFVRLWHMLDSGNIDTKELRGLVVEGLLSHDGVPGTITGPANLDAPSKSKQPGTGPGAAQHSPSVAVDSSTDSDSNRPLRSSRGCNLLRVQSAQASTETTLKVRTPQKPAVGKTASNGSPLNARYVHINDNLFEDVPVTLVYKVPTRDAVFTKSLRDVAKYTMPDSNPGVRINAATIRSPVTYSRSTLHVHLPHATDFVVVRMKNNKDLEEFLERLKGLNPDIDAMTESRSVCGEPAIYHANAKSIVIAMKLTITFNRKGGNQTRRVGRDRKCLWISQTQTEQSVPRYFKLP